MDQKKRVFETPIEPGEPIYDSDGQYLGRVTGFTDEEFEVEITSENAESEEFPGQEFGEGYLMWRCTECGEMGDLEDGMPESCPACGAPAEAITAMRED